MITKDNLKDVLLGLTNDEVLIAMAEDGDYVLVELSVFNAGSITKINSYNYDEEIEANASEFGDLFIDKDDFLRISEEVGINWEL